MYNRYIPSGTGYTRVTMDERAAGSSVGEKRSERASQGQSSEERLHKNGTSHQTTARNGMPRMNLLGSEDKNAGIAGILKALKLEELDSGDILLLLIMLFLFLEGDNIELVITLGLMLLLGLGEDKGNEKQSDAAQKE